MQPQCGLSKPDEIAWVLLQENRSGTSFTCRLCVTRRWINPHHAELLVIITNRVGSLLSSLRCWMFWWVQGELQYFIGVQLDGSEYVEPARHRLSDNTEKASAKLVSQSIKNSRNLYSSLHYCNRDGFVDNTSYFIVSGARDGTEYRRRRSWATRCEYGTFSQIFHYFEICAIKSSRHFCNENNWMDFETADESFGPCSFILEEASCRKNSSEPYKLPLPLSLEDHCKWPFL